MVSKDKNEIAMSIKDNQNKAMKVPQQLVHSSVALGLVEDIFKPEMQKTELGLEVINKMMQNPKVIELERILGILKLYAMRENFHDMITGDEPPSEEFITNLHYLANSQKTAKELATLNNIIKKADFTYNSATVDQIIYDPKRELNKEQIDRLSNCSYIEKGENVCIFGSTGAGKTFLSCAFGMAAAQRLYKVRYFRLPQLLNFLRGLPNDLLYKEIAKIHRIDLVIIDEFLNYQIEEKESRLLLELLEDRRNKSVIFVSICTPEQWVMNLGGSTPLAESIVDRIVHNTHNIIIKGDKSMRERDRPEKL